MNIGFIGGSFKPPHIGHYKMLVKAAAMCDRIHIVISDRVRDGITAEQSYKVWEQYVHSNASLAAGSSVTLDIVPVTPIRAIYETVNEMNDSPDASETDVYLYTDVADSERYNRMGAYKNIRSINTVLTDRLASASDLRDALKRKDAAAVEKFIPSHVRLEQLQPILGF